MAAGKMWQEGDEKLHGAAVPAAAAAVAASAAGGAFSGQRALSPSLSLPVSVLSVIHASNWIPRPAEQHLAAAERRLPACKPLIREMRVCRQGPDSIEQNLALV